MNGETQKWAQVECVDVELPSQVGEALRTARQRAGTARLPVVRAGLDVVCIALADFTAWYGPLPEPKAAVTHGADEARERT